MKKRIVKTMLALLLGCTAAGVMTGCTAPGQKEEEEEQAIEASVKKVTVEVGEEAEIEIENWEDLKKLDFEVDDEDIATVEEDDDGVFIVTGISEGKTTVVFSAKDCEDVTIKITVEGGMEAQGGGTTDPGPGDPGDTARGGEILLSDYSYTLDYDNYDAYIYITNWDQIKDAVGSSLTVTTSDSNMLYASEVGDDGGIRLSNYDVGTATVTIAANGFDPVYCTVTCTHVNDNGNGGGGSDTEAPDYVDVNSDGTINLWGDDDVILETFHVPSGYTLDADYGSGKTVFLNCDSLQGYYVTVYGAMPYTEWDYLINDNVEAGFSYDYHEIGTYNGESVYVGDRHDPDNANGEVDMVQIFFPYETANGYTDFVTIEFYPEIVDGFTDRDYINLFNEMFDN